MNTMIMYSGLDDVRPFYFKFGTIPIYAERRVLNSLEERFPYIFNNIKNIPSVPSVKINEINGQFVLKKQNCNSRSCFSW